jgi:hypothetical protein
MQSFGGGPVYEYFRHLDYRDIMNLCQTNQGMRQLCRDERLWQYLMKRDFNLPYLGSYLNYRRLYQFYHETPFAKMAELYRYFFDFEYFLIEPGNESIIDFYKCTLKRTIHLTGKNYIRSPPVPPGTFVPQITIHIGGILMGEEGNFFNPDYPKFTPFT